MHATMMNFYPLSCQSMVIPSSPSDPITSFSPAGTPSPPSLYHHLPLRPYHYQPIKAYHQEQLNKAHQQEQLNKAPARPKRSFMIEAILGLKDDRDFCGGALRYDGRRDRLRQAGPYAAVTPRTALTALLPSSPESSPKKDDSKHRSHPLSSTTDDSDVESIYTHHLHHHGSSNQKSGHKSPPQHSATNGKMKRIRTIFTPEQLERLESEFERQQYMVGPERLYLASTLNLSESQVKIWFQNRRIKWRKQHMEMEQARLAQLKDNDGSTPGRDQGDSESDGEQGNQLSPLQSWEDYSDDRN
ncbi:hypothetical protein JTE90_017797 [Oedothorax gibbosus]|uniref:Homeobox domain-containing protein n=1 Tax=Oedothorax gibbosus TaxID=931172 RepID=A0AAV6U733_9ARAC|nr:hypothetical protein JTE90_017797 [Oedothorax gibbosus]